MCKKVYRIVTCEQVKLLLMLQYLRSVKDRLLVKDLLITNLRNKSLNILERDLCLLGCFNKIKNNRASVLFRNLKIKLKTKLDKNSIKVLLKA